MQTRLHFAALLFTSIAFTQVAQADQLAAIKAKGELVCGIPNCSRGVSTS